MYTIKILVFFRDELLPLVHQTWQPLRLLFSSNNLFVVEKAFEVLKTMAQTAKDFIRKRTLDDVFPPLVNYLRKLQVTKRNDNFDDFHTMCDYVIWQFRFFLRQWWKTEAYNKLWQLVNHGGYYAK